jgi:hypothetical protein
VLILVNVLWVFLLVSFGGLLYTRGWEDGFTNGWEVGEGDGRVRAEIAVALAKRREMVNAGRSSDARPGAIGTARVSTARLR